MYYDHHYHIVLGFRALLSEEMLLHIFAYILVSEYLDILRHAFCIYFSRYNEYYLPS